MNYQTQPRYHGNGKVYVYSGATSGLLFSLDAPVAPGNFGSSIAGGADADGDGVCDILVGSPYNGFLGGWVHLYSGQTRQLVWAVQGLPNESFGRSVALADLDGDGRPERIVGAPYATWPNLEAIYSCGAVYVYSGQSGQLLAVKHGGQAQAMFGWCVANVGDVNLDGWEDLAVGEPGYDSNGVYDQGRVHLWTDIFSNPVVYQKKGYGRFGESICAGAKIGIAGYPDLIVGASRKVYVFPPLNPARELILTSGETLFEAFGQSVAFAGHGASTTDGIYRVAVGAPYHAVKPTPGYQYGKVYVFDTTGTLLRSHIGSAHGDDFGRSVLGLLRDSDGDGQEDVAAGATYRDGPAGINSGSVTIF